MQVDSGVSKKYPSKTRQSLLSSLKIKPCGVIWKSGKNFSIQHGNIASHLLRSSLFKVVSTFEMLLETEAWLPQERDCMHCYAVTLPMKFAGLWWCSAHLSWASSSGGRVSLHSLRILHRSLKESVWFPMRERIVEGTFSLRIDVRNRNCNLNSIGIEVCDAWSGSCCNILNATLGSVCERILWKWERV